MKTAEQFIKVYIKSEADLPDKTGYYVIWLKNNMNLMSVKWYVQHDKTIWSDVVSYLQPIPEHTEGKSALEVLRNNMNDNLWTFISTYPVAHKSDIMLRDWIIDAMKEYAQSHQVEMPSDEQVYKVINGEVPHTISEESEVIFCFNEKERRAAELFYKWFKYQIK